MKKYILHCSEPSDESMDDLNNGLISYIDIVDYKFDLEVEIEDFQIIEKYIENMEFPFKVESYELKNSLEVYLQ